MSGFVSKVRLSNAPPVFTAGSGLELDCAPVLMPLPPPFSEDPVGSEELGGVCVDELSVVGVVGVIVGSEASVGVGTEVSGELVGVCVDELLVVGVVGVTVGSEASVGV
jgi:hypothetical protein